MCLIRGKQLPDTSLIAVAHIHTQKKNRQVQLEQDGGSTRQPTALQSARTHLVCSNAEGCLAPRRADTPTRGVAKKESTSPRTDPVAHAGAKIRSMPGVGSVAFWAWCPPEHPPVQRHAKPLVDIPGRLRTNSKHWPISRSACLDVLSTRTQPCLLGCEGGGCSAGWCGASISSESHSGIAARPVRRALLRRWKEIAARRTSLQSSTGTQVLAVAGARLTFAETAPAHPMVVIERLMADNWLTCLSKWHSQTLVVDTCVETSLSAGLEAVQH